MSDFEYRTVAAPRRVKKIKGVKGKDAQFAVAVEDVIREQAADGWDYIRTDQFEVEEAGGLLSKSRAVQRSVMVFRRLIRRAAPRPAAPAEPAAPRMDPPRQAEATAPRPQPAPSPQPEPATQARPTPAPQPATPYVAAPAPQPQFAEPAAPAPARSARNEPGFSIAGVEPPKRDRDGG